MLKDAKYHSDNATFVNNVITSGYTQKVPNESLIPKPGKVWYLPHHGIYHPKKPNKICIVFDCSANFQGVSLNDHLIHVLEIPFIYCSYFFFFFPVWKSYHCIALIGYRKWPALHNQASDCYCLSLLYDLKLICSVYRIVFRFVHVLKVCNLMSCMEIKLLSLRGKSLLFVGSFIFTRIRTKVCFSSCLE